MRLSVCRCRFTTACIIAPLLSATAGFTASCRKFILQIITSFMKSVGLPRAVISNRAKTLIFADLKRQSVLKFLIWAAVLFWAWSFARICGFRPLRAEVLPSAVQTLLQIFRQATNMFQRHSTDATLFQISLHAVFVHMFIRAQAFAKAQPIWFFRAQP